MIRLAAQLLYGSYVRPDTWEYDVIARDLLAGEGYHYRFFETEWLTFGFPAFPLLLAGLHWLGGGPSAYGPILVAMAALSAGVAPLAYRIALRLSGPPAALVAGVLVALDPPLVLFGARVHELNLDALLLAAVLTLVLEQAAGRNQSALPLGVVAGISALARPTVFAFAAIAIVAVAISLRRRGPLLAIAIAVVLASPWTIRNAVVLGGVGAASPYNCATVWMGNNRHATGGPLTADGRSVFHVIDDDLRSRTLGRPELEQGRAFCDDAARFLSADPVKSATWWATKFFYFWWFPPHAGIFYPSGWIDLYRPLYLIQLVLAVLGALAVWRRGSRLGLAFVGLELLMISLSQSFGYVEGRHRLILEPTLLALAAAALVSIPSIRRAFGSPPTSGSP